MLSPSALPYDNASPVVANGARRTAQLAVKRAIDVGLGSLSLLLAAPIIGVAAALLWWVGGRPVFFLQKRTGLAGRPIHVWKIRTMNVEAEHRLECVLSADPRLAEEWITRMKLTSDPRVVPGIGEWLRRSSIDELPQLLAVVLGEMSLVGPRPLPAYHLDRFPEEFRRLRALVRPGITGLWQVTVRNDGTLEDQQRLDAHYVRHWSLGMDLRILARTAIMVSTGRGAR